MIIHCLLRHAWPLRLGWGVGASEYIAPKQGLISILMTQGMMDSPEPPPIFSDFWTSTHQALSD